MRLRQAPFGDLGGEAPGGDEDMLGRGMEAAEQPPEPLGGKAGARRDIVGKAGMQRGVERVPIGHAPTPRRPAERALGSDMDRGGLKLRQHLRDAALRPEREADFGVGRARQRPEQVGGNGQHLDAACAQLVDGGAEGADDAVDLRGPGVRDKREPQFAFPASATGAFAAARTRAAQSRISMRPSLCSTSAVQLSTQSPSL